MMGDNGTLWNYPDINVEKPCDGDCVILGMEAGLEYADGKTANINTGMWLHHMVLVAIGPGRRDATCMNHAMSVPHLVVGSNSNSSERIFSSGNERVPFNFYQWGSKYNAGIKITSQDKFALILDLMNENEEATVLPI